MDRLARLLARYGLSSLDPDALIALGERLDELADDLRAEAAEAATAPPSDEALDDVEAIVEATNAVTAAARARDARRSGTRLSRVNAPRPRSTRPRRTAAPHGSTLVASGRRADDDALPDLLARALSDAYRGRVPSLHRADGSVLVASVTANPRVPMLGLDPFANRETITAAVDGQLDALTASGGICAPVEAMYDLPVLPTSARPIRDALVRFNADRGGVRIIPAPTLSDVVGGVSVWTEANDRNPTDPVTKPVAVATCGDEVEVLVAAVTARLRFGNFRARYFGEQVRQWVETLMAQHARVAEQRLVALIDADSVSANAGQILGAARDLLTTVDRAVAHVRYRGRMPLAAPMTCVLPGWARDLMRSDLTRELPGSTAERLATGDAEVDRFFGARHVSPVWSLDSQLLSTTQSDDAPLLGWPSLVEMRIFPTGSWLFVDGGTLDLGVMRDSTLNDTNDAEMFSETFESAIRVAGESLRVVADVCPDGATSGTVDIDPCFTGS